MTKYPRLIKGRFYDIVFVTWEPSALYRYEGRKHGTYWFKAVMPLYKTSPYMMVDHLAYLDSIKEHEPQ